LGASEAASFSPDGDRLAYSLGAEVCVANGDGRAHRCLAPGYDAAWSPDGRRVIFTSYDATPSKQPVGISSVSANGGNVRMLTPAEPAFSPVVSVRGEIAFERATPVPGSSEMGSTIWVMRANGTGLRLLTRGPDDALGDWSPDGRHLVFTQGDHGDHPMVVVANARTRSIKTIATGISPVWAPDGGLIVYRPPFLSDLTSVRFSVIRPDGTGRRTITVPPHQEAIFGYGDVLPLDWQPVR
jgi:Tol biopolymer transport system component